MLNYTKSLLNREHRLPTTNIIIIQDNEQRKPFYTNLKAINVKVKKYAIFWPERTKDKSNDNTSLHLQSIISCITNDAVIADSVILTGYKKIVGEVRGCFDYCCEKCFKLLNLK